MYESPKTRRSSSATSKNNKTTAQTNHRNKPNNPKHQAQGCNSLITYCLTLSSSSPAKRIQENFAVLVKISVWHRTRAKRHLILASFYILTVEIDNNDNHPTNSPAKSSPRKTKSMPAIIAFDIAGCNFFQSFLLAYFFCNPGRCLQRVGQKGRLLFFSVMPAKALRWQYCSLVHKGPCDENIRVQWQCGSSRIIFTRLTSGSSMPSRLGLQMFCIASQERFCTGRYNFIKGYDTQNTKGQMNFLMLGWNSMVFNLVEMK